MLTIIRKMLKPSFIVMFMVCLPLLALGFTSPSHAKDKRAVIVISFDSFNDTEYSFSRETLEAAGCQITVASSKTGNAEASEGTVVVDILADQINPSDFDALVFIGGMGVAEEFYDNKNLSRIIKEAASQGKVVAAICAAQRLLYSADVIEYQLPTQKPAGQNVRVEKNVILGGGPEDAEFFAQAVLKAVNQAKP